MRRIRASLGIALILAMSPLVGANAASPPVAARLDQPTVVEGSSQPSAQSRPALWMGPARARRGDRYRTFSRRIHWSGQQRLPEMRRCVEFLYTGRLVFKFIDASEQWDGDAGWIGTKLVRPRAQLWAYDRCTARVEDYRERRRFGDVRVRMGFYGTGGRGCDLNPSLSFSVPWSASLSFTPECGQRTRRGWRARAAFDPDEPQHTYIVPTIGRALRWESHETVFADSPFGVCFKAVLNMTISNPEGNTTVPIGRKSAGICTDLSRGL